jgi:hypothetical protein
VCTTYLLLDNITISTCRKIEIRTTYDNRSWRSSWFKILPMIPSLHSVTCSIYLKQLGSFIDAVKHAPLRTLSITIIADKVTPAVTGLSGLESLHIRWTVNYFETQDTKLDMNLCDFSWGLIQPSIDTLHDLRLRFEVDEDNGFNVELLKPANLHTFFYEATNANTDMITQLPTILPHVEKLSLLWKSWGPHPPFKVSRCLRV